MHKKQRHAPSSIPHEKSDYDAAMKIKSILEAKTTLAEQDKLHEHDENTTWFGIVREDGDLPLFRDYGRYANIMTNALRSSSRHGSRWMPGARDHRFPSLVSFVGQTGSFIMPSQVSMLIYRRCRKEYHNQIGNRT